MVRVCRFEAGMCVNKPLPVFIRGDLTCKQLLRWRFPLYHIELYPQKQKEGASSCIALSAIIPCTDALTVYLEYMTCGDFCYVARL